jgi:tetratricopeptide (TPR) repeat protein
MEIWRGDPLATLSAAQALERTARERGVAQYLNEAELHSGSAQGRIDDPTAGAAQVRRVLAALVEQGVRVNLGFYTGLLAQLEAETLGADSALARIDEAFRLSNAVEHGCSLPFLHRLRGEIVLKRDPADPAPAEEAFRTSIAIAKEQGARSPVLLASLALAKLLQSTTRLAEAHAVLIPALEGFSPTRLAEAHAVLIPALEGFSPTPEMPEIAEAQALLGALAETEEVKAAEAQRQRRLHLQMSYGRAMMWTKGFAAEETKVALARATDLTATTDDFADRFAMAHGQWTFALMQGELQSARQLTSAFLKEAEAAGLAVEAGVARRGLAQACYFSADFLEARTHCERALETCDPERERETKERFHDAIGPVVMSILAMTTWQLGEVERARELIEQANRRASELGHALSMAGPLSWKPRLEILRGDPAAALIAAEALQGFGQEHGLPFYRTLAELSVAWARGRLHDAATGAEDLSRALADRIEQGSLTYAWYYKALLAELEAETLGAENALARIDEAMALARQVETRCNLPFLHLLRGKLLLERDPSNPAPAEEAFRTALAMQGARSWGLRAALSLATLYQSTARPVDAHAVLAPALEGFSPTPEMPEIAEAQALLATLAERDQVKAEIARRERRFKLESSYAQAVGWSKGFGAEDTQRVFDRVAQALTTDVGAGADRLAALQGRWAALFMRGGIATAREAAENFRKAAETARVMSEQAAARRSPGATLLAEGDLVSASNALEEALALADQYRTFGAGPDPGATAAAHLSLASWIMGDPSRSRALIEEAAARAERTEHVPTRTVVRYFGALREMMRGDARASLPLAEAFIDACRERGVEQFLGAGRAILAWAQDRLEDDGRGLSEFRQRLASLSEQGHRLYLPFYLGRLAEIELSRSGPNAALGSIEAAQGQAQDTSQRAFDAFLEGLRGEALLASGRADAAERALHSSIEIARRQGARSHVLLASLSLAKLCQSMDRPADAHAVLTPALEGFSPTPEMPEIAEAQALVERFARGGDRAIPAKDPATKG